MSTNTKIFALVGLISAAASILHAQTLTGQRLNVGPASGSLVNSVSSNLDSAAIGIENQVSAQRSLAVGRGNQMSWGQNFAVGYLNIVAGTESGAIGSSNNVRGGSSLAVGSQHYFGSSSEDGNAWASLAVGHANYLSYTSRSTLVSGYNNVATGLNGFLAGSGLINEWANAAVVGRYNDAAQTTEPLFVVGNGTGTPADGPSVERRNAFVVNADGSIYMREPQGDIAMGEFGTPTN